MSKKISELTAATTPLGGTETVEIVQGGTSKKVAVSYLGGSGGGREALSSNRTYYVRTDGSDSNDGLANTSGGAFLTIQKAIDVVSSTLDISAGVTVTIQVADGTYTGTNVLYDTVGPGSVIIRGNNTTPSNVVISTTSADCFTCSGGKSWSVLDLKVTTATSGWGLSSLYGGVLKFGNLDFGTCATGHVLAAFSGQVFANSDYQISGASSYHLFLDRFGYVEVSGKTITITGTPAFSSVFARASGLSEVFIDSCAFSGSATGKRYDILSNSVIATGGAATTYLPGSVAGTTATGGQYV